LFFGPLLTLPQDKNSQAADTMEVKGAKEKPKVALVNDQFKGELVGQKSTEDSNSLLMVNRKQAHGLTSDVRMVNEQVRGELAGLSHRPFLGQRRRQE